MKLISSSGKKPPLTPPKAEDRVTIFKKIKMITKKYYIISNKKLDKRFSLSLWGRDGEGPL